MDCDTHSKLFCFFADEANDTWKGVEQQLRHDKQKKNKKKKYVEQKNKPTEEEKYINKSSAEMYV